MSLDREPYVERATFVVTMSDGSRISYVIEGGPDGQLEMSTAVHHEEVYSARYAAPAALFETSRDYTFKLTGMAPAFTQETAEPPEPREVEQSPRAVEAGRDTN